PNKFHIYRDGEWEFIGDDLEEVYENISNLGDDLGDLAEDLFEYQTDTEASIERNQAELGVLSDEISTKVSKTEYDRDYEEITDNYTEFKQEYNNFTSSVQVGGGNNLILNSVGYGELNYWKKNSGNI